VRGDPQIKEFVRPLFEDAEGVLSFCTFAVDKTAASPYQMLHYALGGTPLRARLVHQWRISGYPVYSDAFFVGKRCIVVWHEMGDVDPAPLYFIDSERSESAAILDPARSVRCSKPAGAFRDTASGADGLVVWANETNELVGRRYSRGDWSALYCFGIKSGGAISIEFVGEGRYWVFTDAKGVLKLYELRVSDG